MFSSPLEIVFVDFVFSMTWLYLLYVFNIHPTQSLLQRFNSCWGKPFDGEVGKGIKFLQLASYRGRLNYPTSALIISMTQLRKVSFCFLTGALFTFYFTSHRCSCHLLYRSPFPSASLLSGVPPTVSLIVLGVRLIWVIGQLHADCLTLDPPMLKICHFILYNWNVLVQKISAYIIGMCWSSRFHLIS